MRKLTFLLFGSVIFWGASLPDTYAIPPAPIEIQKTINQFWVEEEFFKIDPYIAKLSKSYPNYMPVEIADAIQAYRKGAQVEALVSKIEKNIVKISRHLPEVPPNCFEVLEGVRVRFQKSADWYKQKGYSKSWRMGKYNPLNMSRDKRAKKWSYGFELLFKVCPAANFPNNRLEPVTRFHQDKINPKVEKLKIGKLKQVIFDKNQPEELRLSAVTLYAKKANSKEMAVLLDCIEFHNFKIAQKCAYEVSGVSEKEEIISRLFEKVDKPNTHIRRYSLWALVRLDPKDGRTLKKVKEIAGRMGLGRTYAQQILGYLEGK